MDNNSARITIVLHFIPMGQDATFTTTIACREHIKEASKQHAAVAAAWAGPGWVVWARLRRHESQSDDQRDAGNPNSPE